MFKLKIINFSLKNPENFAKGAKALASNVRMQMLQLLHNENLNINELSERLKIPFSTAALNVKILEDAGIIFTELRPGSRGSVMKICSRKYDVLSFDLLDNKETDTSKNTFNMSMPIGNYCDCDISPTCGLLSEYGTIDIDDDPKSFYSLKRNEAQLLWFYKGFVEYRFPNAFLSNALATSFELSFEACSEAPFYRLDWPSDITVWINNNEIGTWTSSGDFGGNRGNLTPDWWPESSTQYGILTRWNVRDNGTYINGNKATSVKIHELELENENYISVKIGIKDSAKNIGGINIFGSKFGNYPQDIVLNIDYKMK